MGRFSAFGCIALRTGAVGMTQKTQTDHKQQLPYTRQKKKRTTLLLCQSRSSRCKCEVLTLAQPCLLRGRVVRAHLPSLLALSEIKSESATPEVPFVDLYNLLVPIQYFFRKIISTKLALLAHEVNYKTQCHKVAHGLFLDFSKAVHFVNHNVLLRMLEFYGTGCIASF